MFMKWANLAATHHVAQVYILLERVCETVCHSAVHQIKKSTVVFKIGAMAQKQGSMSKGNCVMSYNLSMIFFVCVWCGFVYTEFSEQHLLLLVYVAITDVFMVL